MVPSDQKPETQLDGIFGGSGLEPQFERSGHRSCNTQLSWGAAPSILQQTTCNHSYDCMWSAVGSTGLHPRTTAYCNSDGRFAQIGVLSPNPRYSVNGITRVWAYNPNLLSIVAGMEPSAWP